MSTITRRIHFFKAEFSYFEAATGETVTRTADMGQVFEAMKALVWDVSADNTAYAEDSDGFVALNVVEVQESRVFGQFAKSRRQGLPPMEVAGNISALPLPADAGLYEAAHFGIFWGDGHPVLAMEYNPYAPRHARLAKHLVDRLRGHEIALLDEVRFTPIVRGDVFEQLMEAGPLARVELAVVRDALSDVRSAARRNSLYEALEARASISVDMETVGLYLHRGQNVRRGGGGPELKRALQDIISILGRGALVWAKADVERRDSRLGQLQHLNLLEDKWIHSVSVPKLVNRGIDPSAMFDEISRVHGDFVEEYDRER